MSSNRLDIILFGATGFAGRHTILSLANLMKNENYEYKWGIAGRSKSKLQRVLFEASCKINEDLTSTPIIIAEAEDEDSLKQMTSKARIIINTCGPFILFGEQIIKACLTTRTHHIDISEETKYMEEIQLKYHEEAMNKNVYLINACGFNSVPADFGVIFLRENFKNYGTLHSIETYLNWNQNISGSFVSYSVWKSAIHSYSKQAELIEIRQKLFHKRIPIYPPILKSRGKCHKSKFTNGWCVPMLGCNRSVIIRTQRYLYEEYRARPIHVQTYFCIKSFIVFILTSILTWIFKKFVNTDFGCDLLLKHPHLFSFGTVSKDIPFGSTDKTSSFSMSLIGSGWDKETESSNGEYDIPPNTVMVIEVSGKNPGYGVTANVVTCGAVCILKETTKLPKTGGVYSPGAAFLNTSFLKEICKNGMNFDVLSVKYRNVTNDN